ncbi:putative disease resistance protein RGA1 [Spinacia oleracea]|uniref:Disease resistance protein RGA1 n=1 Tax=Spinacia oleracea TaxID=3562 RepID=A0A9R0JT77_SPIOL|nr:putative disease resistance protein RGA1 [Spinacia oleracea]
MESVVLPLLVETVKPMIEVLMSRVTEEIHFFRGSGKDLSKLERKIQIISNIVLNMTATNTSTCTSSSNPVELWVTNVVKIIHNVENLLDVLAYEKQRQVVMKIGPMKRVYFRRKIGKWISRINTNIDEALIEAQTIAHLRDLMHSLPPATNIITSEGAAAEDQDRLQQLRRNVDMSLIVGRDSDVDSMVDKLCNPSQDYRLSVVAIVGIGGIGKTVLAKNVFEDKRVTDNFTERIWVAAPEAFSIEGILNKMLEYIHMSSSVTTSSSEIAVRKLKGNLDGKKYLLVLDDVWNVNQHIWDATRSSLERIGGSQESMILVTTRGTDVAQTMNAFVHPLPELSEDDSWYLFKKVAFTKMSQEYISIFETTGKNIVKKCKGVPLAIKSIGGMLQTKRHAYEWEKIEQSELWDLPQDGTGILPSLKLSYKHLSSPFLQKCFSFCAALPKDWSIGKSWLIRIWTALGLVRRSENRELIEDIAEEYINELLSISFLHVVERDEIGETLYYGMHDLVHDLAKSVSKHELLLLEAGNSVTAISDVQHLAIYEHKELKTDCWDKVVVENLCTLIIYKSLPGGLLKHVKYLRVLNLRDMGLEEVPEAVAGLKCLKFLSLTNNPIKVLPEFITELYNLQSLDIYKCNLLEEVPGGLSNLVNLRHFIMMKLIKLPAKMIGQLKCLQTLPRLLLTEGGFQISELGGLPHVSGRLTIVGLELIKSKQDAESARLSEKSRVNKLWLSWNSDDDWIKHEEVLDGLKPNCNLRRLIVQSYGGEKFPSWLMRMDVIKIIELVDCRRCQKLPTLGHLPFLEKLGIEYMRLLEYIGVEFYCNSYSSEANSSMVYFPRLKQLELLGLGKLTEWVEPSSGEWTIFPLLEELKIEDCPELKTTPYKFPSLEQLTVKNITSGLLLTNIISNKVSVTCLKVLQIEGITEMTHLPEVLAEYCTSLQTLRINRCRDLSCLPESLSKMISLELLQIKWCPNLVSVPCNLSGFRSLRELEILYNVGLTSVPEGLQSCTAMEKLWISCCPKIETLPDLTGLNSLHNLSLRSMIKMITDPPDWLYRLPCLTTLHIGYCEDRDEFPDMSFLWKVTSLETLNLCGWGKLQNLPEELQQFTMLKGLGICEFENMECFPDWFGNLSSLNALCTARCKNLKKLPTEDAMKRLAKLSYLDIEDCPLLENAVKVNGTEHHKISKIEVRVNGRFL